MIDLVYLDLLEFDDMFDCDLSCVILECFIDCLMLFLKYSDGYVIIMSVNFVLNYVISMCIILLFFVLLNFFIFVS